jgi:hypothetical protein
MNALANHHILPHNGKNITKAAAVSALASTINFDTTVASRFFDVALLSSPDGLMTHSQDLDNLSRHGIIEHDVSLSRSDASLGNNSSYDSTVWKESAKSFGEDHIITVNTASQMRYERLIACKKAHEDLNKDVVYGIKEMLFSYGESALYLSVMGNHDTKQVPVEYVRVLIGKYLI